MQGQLKTPVVDVMPVLVDRESRLVEAVAVDHVFVSSREYDDVRKQVTFVLGFAGVDSRGTLHLAQESVLDGVLPRDRQLAQVVMKGPAYSKHFATANGNPRYDIPIAELNMLFAEVLLPLANQVWKLDLEVVVDGRTVYKTGQPAKQKNFQIPSAR